ERLIANGRQIHRTIQARSPDRRFREEDGNGRVGRRIAVPFLHGGLGQLQRLHTELHGLQRDVGRLAVGGLHGVHPCGLFFLGRFRQAHRGEHAFVGPRVLVDQGLEASLDDLPSVLDLREFGFDSFVSGLPASETRDHTAQGRGQRSRESRDASPSRRGSRRRDRGEELFHGRILHSHNRASRTCSRWNRASLKYWVAPRRTASRGTNPMISLSTISTRSFVASSRIASKAWTSEVWRYSVIFIDACTRPRPASP